MKPYQLRVIEEQKELQTKLDGLSVFLEKGRPDFVCRYEWNMLKDQFNHMEKYNNVLIDRIGLFNVPGDK